MTLDALDDDDRVIDYEADCQHETEKRERVDGKTEQREKYERSYQRNRHSQQRDQCGTPPLKKKKNNNNDKDERDKKSFDYFLDALGYRKRRVEGNGEIHIIWKALFHLRHQCLDAGGSIDSIRSG